MDESRAGGGRSRRWRVDGRSPARHGPLQRPASRARGSGSRQGRQPRGVLILGSGTGRHASCVQHAMLGRDSGPLLLGAGAGASGTFRQGPPGPDPAACRPRNIIRPEWQPWGGVVWWPHHCLSSSHGACTMDREMTDWPGELIGPSFPCLGRPLACRRVCSLLRP